VITTRYAFFPRYDGTPSASLPYVVVRGKADEVRAVVERSVCVKFCIEIWGEGASWAECHAAVRAQPAHVTAPMLSCDTPFRCAFEAWGRKRIPQAYRAELLRGAEYLDLRGPVSMKAASRVFYFVESFAGPNDLEPSLAFFGPLVAESRREDISAYDLRRRKMIGNTSMDPELSFIMASMARAAPGTLILDPFVGTGSLLYAAAHFGAAVVGCDINKVVLHGIGKTSRTGGADKKRGPEENIAATMAQ
jgi:tRNA (guanine10-N2)-methyltransferase